MTEKRAPYYDTSVGADVPRNQIEKMLYEHEAANVSWLSSKEGFIVLEFLKKIEIEGVKRPMGFRVKPPLFLKSIGRGYKKKEIPHPAQSMRLLHWWLKTKLEAVKYGLRSMEQEFLADISGQLPSGEKVTVGEIFIPVLKKPGVLDPGEILKALPSGEEEED